MSKQLITNTLRDSAGLTVAGASSAYDDMIAVITKTLKKQGRIALPGLGTLEVRKASARKGTHPGTGEAIKIKATKRVRFRAHGALKATI